MASLGFMACPGSFLSFLGKKIQNDPNPKLGRRVGYRVGSSGNRPYGGAV